MYARAVAPFPLSLPYYPPSLPSCFRRWCLLFPLVPATGFICRCSCCHRRSCRCPALSFVAFWILFWNLPTDLNEQAGWTVVFSASSTALDTNRCTRWGGYFFRRFCSTFSESSPCLLGQHGSCSTAQQPGNSPKIFYKTSGTSGRPTWYSVYQLLRLPIYSNRKSWNTLSDKHCS